MFTGQTPDAPWGPRRGPPGPSGWPWKLDLVTWSVWTVETNRKKINPLSHIATCPPTPKSDPRAHRDNLGGLEIHLGQF